MYDYNLLITEFNVKNTEDLYKVFWEVIAYDWIDAYEKMGIHGTITLQRFWGYTFIIDDGNQLRDHSKPLEKEILEARVVAGFGISTQSPMKGNRKKMRTWLGKTSEVFSPYGLNYDKGHFLAHAIGGPIDVNLFPQRRDINRGWSEDGKDYRKMEKYIASNPGTFVFSRPIYTDGSFCPTIIEFGYCNASLDFIVKQFPNR